MGRDALGSERAAMTIWTYYGLIRTTDRVAANAAAALIDHDVGGSKTFDTAAPARAKGSASTTPTAFYKHTWLTGVRRTDAPDKLSGKELVDELMSAGPYPNLNKIGLANNQIAYLRSKMVIETFSRLEGPQKTIAQFADERGEELFNDNSLG